MAFSVLEGVTLSIVPRMATLEGVTLIRVASFGVLDKVTLSFQTPSAILNNIVLSQVPSNKQATLSNVTLSIKVVSASLDNVILSVAPEITPITEYLSFNHILSGSLADYLMEIYNEVVQGHSFGVVNDPEVLRVNRSVGRTLFQVEFSDSSIIKTSTYHEFLYFFVLAVAAGKRLKGSNDMERHMSLAKYLPSTFNPNWLLAVAVNK